MSSGNEVLNTGRLLLQLGTVAAFILSAPAVAQQAVDGETDSSGNVLMDDILVTATKKGHGERIQDVPASITAFSGEQLDQMQFRSVESIAFSAPNVQLDDVGSIKGTANFVIRGLGVNSSTPSVEPTVATVINGIYLGTNNGTVFDATDIESIEILRGPQGVLFGRNVTGGAVVLRTRRPGGDFGVDGKIALESGLRGTGTETILTGGIEGPIVEDKLLVRLSGYFSHDTGYFRNETLQRNDGKADSWFVRPTIVFRPTDRLEFTVIAEKGRSSGDGTVNSNPGGAAQAPKFGTKSGFVGEADLKYSSIVFETNIDVGPGNGRITNIAGYREYNVLVTGDNDGTISQGFHVGSYIDQSQYSNELRYSVRIADRIDFVTGLFLFKQDIDYQTLDSLLFANRIGKGGGLQHQNSWGVFANADYDITSKLTLGFGGRISADRKRVHIAARDFSANAPCEFQQGCRSFNFNDEAKFNSFTPRAFLRYEFTDDIQAYALYSRGVRAGGYNLRVASLDVPPGPFEDEIANSYELGFKGRMFDRRLNLNLAVFQNNIDEIQREQTTVTQNGVSTVLGNAGDIRIRGFEAEASVQIADGLVFRGSVGHVDGRYTRVFADLNGDGVVDDRDLALRIPRLAPWTFSAGLFYDTELGDSGSLSANVNFDHRDGSPFTDSNSTFLPSVDMLAAGLAFSPSAVEGLRLSLYARNLLDSRNVGANASLSILPTGGYFQTVQKGRIFGLEAAFSF